MRIWTNHYFTDDELNEIRERFSAHEFTHFAPEETGNDGESRAALIEAEIAFGTPDADTLFECPNLKWFHINLAGYTPYDRGDLRANFRLNGRIFTNSSAVYAEPCAQHALTMMLAFARHLPYSFENQRSIREWPYYEYRDASVLLNGQSVLMLGFGRIARRLVELLKPFDMRVTGYRRNITGTEGVPMVTDLSLDEALSRADHVMNILPANESTRNFFDTRRFGVLKQGARFYNIGRGSTVDQEALMTALDSGFLRSAYLDVTTPEPLPKDHPLWSTPNCFITPHTAGGFSGEPTRHIEHFLENLRRFENGEEMLDRIF